MKPEQIQTELLAALGEIAPEADLSTVDAARPLRQQLDLDSADWLNFLVAVHNKLGIDIPDAQAAKLRSLDQWVAYCAGVM
jgi:acyl carrier protein